MSDKKNEHTELINKLYTTFQNLDGRGMMACYHKDAYFKDEVFELHGRKEVAGMWMMLTQRAKDFHLEYKNVEASEESGSVDWEATYLFSKTGRKVHNKIHGEFEFKDGLIIKHIDTFDFWKWSRMALGFPGLLLGWSGFLRRKVQDEAMSNLKKSL